VKTFNGIVAPQKMTPFFATLTLDLILVSPFIGAACAIVWAIRALVKGEVVSSGRFSRRRTIYRSVNPIQFWIELGLYGVTITLLLALGLMFFDDASRFFYELVRNVHDQALASAGSTIPLDLGSAFAPDWRPFAIARPGFTKHLFF
jgi:hypothetical protein